MADSLVVVGTNPAINAVPLWHAVGIDDLVFGDRRVAEEH